MNTGKTIDITANDVYKNASLHEIWDTLPDDVRETVYKAVGYFDEGSDMEALHTLGTIKDRLSPMQRKAVDYICKQVIINRED